MAKFPETFTTEPITVDPAVLPAHLDEPFYNLQAKGFSVVIGLELDELPSLTEIAGQPGVREFCARDLEERWGNTEMATRQLAKGGGRGVMLLKEISSQETAGFGWLGSADEKEQGYTGGDITFAIRMNERFAGRKLAPDFTNAIVMGGMHFFDARKIGWETWSSNAAAVNTYVRAGALLTKAMVSERPTLDTAYPLATEGKYAGKHVREDTRLYFKAPASF